MGRRHPKEREGKQKRWPLIYGGCQYSTTNEQLEGIVAGLQPKEEDTILAICGSGDQPFALAETGARVFAVDYSRLQIEYATERADAIRHGYYEAFLKRTYGTTRNYFEEGTRLPRIRENLDRISFHEANIFRLPEELNRPYTKMYLSNAPTYMVDDDTPVTARLLNLLRHLQKDGACYLASAPLTLRWRLLFSGLQKIRNATKFARQREALNHGWKPVVYRRT